MSRRILIDDDAAQYENINVRLRRLEQGLPEDVHYVGDSGEPTFQNGWVNFDSGSTAPSAGSRDAGFYRHQGRVYLLGVVKFGASGTNIFVLPDGYRPPLSIIEFAVAANTDFANVGVVSTGAVQPSNRGAASVNTWVYLEGVSFRHA